MPAPNSVPRFVTDSIVGVVQVSTANTNRDGTGTIATVVTASSQGTLIELVRVVATGTTTAGVVRLYIHDGANSRLYEEILVTAITPSTTTAVYEAEFVPTKPLVLPTGYSLRASTHNAETFNVIATGGDY
jgi:hypothetical protein